MKELPKEALHHLEKGIEFELGKGCVNFRGHQLFSDFLSGKLKELKEQTKENLKTPGERNMWESVYSRSLRYPELSLPERNLLLTHLKKLLQQLEKTEVLPIKQLDPESPIQYLKGVGPRLAERFEKLEIKTIEDLLYHFPREYLDRQTLTPINNLQEKETTTVSGKILSLEEIRPRPNLRITKGLLSDGTGMLELIWYHNIKNPYARSHGITEQLEQGDTAIFSGKIKRDPYSMGFQLHNPEFQVTSEESSESAHWGRIVPIYPATENLKVRNIRTLIQKGLEGMLPSLADPLPSEARKEEGLMELSPALFNIHFPKDFDLLKKAKERLIFDEFFYLQLGLAYRRGLHRQEEKGYVLKPKTDLTQKVLKALPFKLTEAQEKACREIQLDLASQKPMMRLLQGDVGSGKTIVALLTLLVAMDNGYQGAFMAPTELLAEQHYRKFLEYLKDFSIQVGYLSGSQTAKEKKALLEGLKKGKTQLVVGTHALFQKEVAFKELALIVVDEQHRFGVEQRGLLRSKGKSPEILNMTATPIPRTLAMTLHGDLDISVLNALPSGRKPVETLVFNGKERKRAYEVLKQEMDKGRQAYVVYPLIEESEKLPLKAVTEGAEYLKNKVFPKYSIGLLHGQMPKAQRDQVMNRFRDGNIQILVATTVIEVGVDVPNATVMMIENGERFGLAQLHQLRGRVGRGGEQSYCLLMEGHFSQLGRERLNIMASSTDGFYIAEKDLELRGPGEFLGFKQSGIPEFKIANLITDKELFEKARKEAFALTEKDSRLNHYPLLLKELKKRFKGFASFLEG